MASNVLCDSLFILSTNIWSHLVFVRLYRKLFYFLLLNFYFISIVPKKEPPLSAICSRHAASGIF